MVDPLRFEQVVTNLLDNAVKFSPAGGTVTVGLGRLDDGSVQLTVTDQGIGIPADQREAVFERFYQAHGEGHLSGFGLGLHVAREIVGRHGGSIRAEQPAHRGARLVVTLPAVDGSPE
jgi:signal transduction histidine kinase